MSDSPFDFNLQGKNAVVTGAIGILGRRFSLGLASQGVNVAIVDLDEEVSSAFAAELSEKYNVKCMGVGCDVSNPDSVKRMVERVVEQFGSIDILHNNAGGKSDDLIAYFKPFEEYPLEEWRKSMAVNIDGVFLVAQAVGKQMVAQGSGGSIIQTASIYGIVAPDNRIYEGSEYLGVAINTPAVYAASKAAVVGLTRYLSTYWASQGIRVNSITPGGVESGQNEQFVRKYANRVPLGRMAQRDELVGALLYLASDLSSYVTGQNIVVDGGLSVW